MSEQPPSPDYWQASDGLWYPPDTHPDQAPTPAGAHDADRVARENYYPARLTVSDDNRIARWRAFAHIFMAIPHLFVLYFIQLVSQILSFVSWFVILITGRLPKGLHDFQCLMLRYGIRTTGFVALLTEEYPPFDFTTTSEDPGDYPIRVDVDYDDGQRDRLTVFIRFLMLIPHIFVLTFVGIAAFFVYIAAWFAVLFTAQMPTGMRNFLIGVGRWGVRVEAYALLLTDEYPPFSLD